MEPNSFRANIWYPVHIYYGDNTYWVIVLHIYITKYTFPSPRNPPRHPFGCWYSHCIVPSSPLRYPASWKSPPFLTMLCVTSYWVPDTTRCHPPLPQWSSKMIWMEYSGRTRIYNQKVPPSQPSHTRLQSLLSLYPGAGSLFYSLIIVKLAEVGLVDDLVNVLRLVSWVLRITMVPLELYIIELVLGICGSAEVYDQKGEYTVMGACI